MSLEFIFSLSLTSNLWIWPEHIWTVPDHHNQDSKRSLDNYKKHLNTYCQFMLCTYKQTVSSNNRSMFVIHATARKLLKPEKKIKRNILPSVLNWETSGYLKKRVHEQKTGRRYWILWQLCEICQKFEGWRKSTLDSTNHSISVLISPYLSSSHIGLHDLPGRSWIFHTNGELVVSCSGPQAKVCQVASTLRKRFPKLCMGGMKELEKVMKSY